MELPPASSHERGDKRVLAQSEGHSREYELGDRHRLVADVEKIYTLKPGLVVINPASIVSHLSSSMSDLKRETFRLLHLDTKNRLLLDEIMWDGTIDRVHIYPREVIRRAIELGTTALIAVHNHPCGDPSPSKSDVEVTNRLHRACDVIEITLHDHLIVGKEGWFSMAAAGLL